ncbi:YybH family protein [Agrobacterium sp. NPDC090283]|uniref:YybH family protein n=1 Tax=Agrobacterium sp. NPDC090283 TaxID=3363920 RepID=UPI00383B4AB9
MSDSPIPPREILQSVWDRYVEAVNTSNAIAYGAIFTNDGIRVVTGQAPERGRDEITRNEQADYDEGDWTIAPSIIDALQISSDAIYGLAEVDVTISPHAGRSVVKKTIIASWLILRQPTGEWLLSRHSANVKSPTPDEARDQAG